MSSENSNYVGEADMIVLNVSFIPNIFVFENIF